jgi:hypothetical protein
MRMWHWVVIVAVIFVCINVWASGTLGGAPVVGGYLSK